MLNVSSINGSATSVELSSLTYKHLYRTVPSDEFLAKVMVDLVTHFNWSYVAVVGQIIRRFLGTFEHMH